MNNAEVVRIANLNVPILCFDTCSALDLMRDPTRETADASDRKTALNLLMSIERSGYLVSLMAKQVRQEFNEHVDKIKEETATALQKLGEKLQRIDEIARAYGASGFTNISHLDDHAKRARKIADRWIASARLIEKTKAIDVRAVQRVLEPRSPARKGKESLKDCIVIETYLDIVRRLRRENLSKPIVFISSNTKEYTREDRMRLKDDLEEDFTSVDLKYAPNFAAAKHYLGL